ncbi:sensor histidine kinase [Virgisporangium aliadipatigenens]|nr:histidine kinase [Virgisporangium aliadipatigenens]
MDLAGLRRSRAWRTAGRHPQWTDAVLGLGVAVLSLFMVSFSPQGQERQDITAYHLIAAGVAFVAVTVRRRAPRRALAGTVAAAVPLTFALGGQPQAVTGTLMVTVYTVALVTDRRGLLLTAAGVCVVGWLTYVAVGDGPWWDPENSANLGFVGMAAAYGDATRSRRAYIAAVEDRATRAEQTREEEARRRVAEERLRIARELHDVVAHHIAVVKVQATGARHIGPRSPEQVAPALDAISRSADAALTEMAFVVGLLRDSGEPAGTRPPRGLAQLRELLADLSGHLSVDYRVTVEGASTGAGELPAVVDAAAYRIALEALTNAQKYGDGTADLTVAYTPQAVTLHIANPVADPAGARGSGYGLVGMRERASAVGGSVTAGMAAPGRFAVRASLPRRVPAVAS